MSVTFDASAYVPEIEQNLLGSLLFEGDARDIFALVQEHHFVDPFHKAIYKAIKAARVQYGSANSAVVKRLIDQADMDAFKKASGLEGGRYVGSLSTMTTSRPNAALPVAKHVIEQWARLAIANEAGRVLAAASDPQSDVRLITSDAAKTFDDIMSEVRSGPSKKTVHSLGEAAQAALNASNLARHSTTGLTGITWGLKDINDKTGGIQRRDLCVIGARPSMGKSSVAMSVLLNAAKAGHSCGFFSLEMDAEKLAARAISSLTFGGYHPVEYMELIKGKISDEQKWAVEEAVTKFKELPIFIDEQAGLSMTDIRIKTERLAERCQKAGTRLEVICIDHLGLIRPSSRYSGNKVNEIGEITSTCKSLARELDIGVVLLSQLSRSIESRDDKRPMLSDLRDSGTIEQDADMIAFLYREAYYLEREKGTDVAKNIERGERLRDSLNKLEFIIAKQRNGPLGTIELFADMGHSAIRNLGHFPISNLVKR